MKVSLASVARVTECLIANRLFSGDDLVGKFGRCFGFGYRLEVQVSWHRQICL